MYLSSNNIGAAAQARLIPVQHINGYMILDFILTQREIEIDRQIERKTDKPTNQPTDRQTDRSGHRELTLPTMEKYILKMYVNTSNRNSIYTVYVQSPVRRRTQVLMLKLVLSELRKSINPFINQEYRFVPGRFDSLICSQSCIDLCLSRQDSYLEKTE